MEILKITLWLMILSIRLISVNSQTSNPLKNPKICGIPSCDIENEKFNYSSNTIYKYSYESSFHTFFEGTDKNDPESKLFISAIAEITFPTKCQGQLKLRSIRLKNLPKNGVEDYDKPKHADYEYEDDTNPQEENTNKLPVENVNHPKSSFFSKDIEEKELRFQFRDGLIQEICPSSDELVWTANFKRGILSAFQNTMFRFDLDHNSIETDVSGRCEVSYRFVGSSNTSLLITKNKDITSCQNRNKFKSFIQSTPYEFRKNDISWWPIYNSSSYCNLSIDNHIYNNIECYESHLLIPFSNDKNGAVAKTSMKLKLLAEIPDLEQTSMETTMDTRKSLVYDHSLSNKPTHNEIKISREYLKQMCTSGFPNIQREFPDRFIKFLAASKQLSAKGLQQLLSRAAGICENGRKHVLESLPFIGSVASVELMKNMITGELKAPEDITPETKRVWLNSMLYLQYSEEKTISTMLSLIHHYEVDHDPMLVLIPTSVTHTFCKSINNCRNSESVMNIVKYLEDSATKSLSKSSIERKNIKDLLVHLKGIGNVGIFSKPFEKVLKDLIVDETKGDDVKLQAIQVFRKSNCGKTREFFMDIYQNFTLSVEIRIASYLQVMKCPTYLTINSVKEFLESEKVNQVGSFVWSHLSNIAKTSSPLKVELQGLLSDDKLDDKFKLDFRKFSKNYENSLFFDEYNFGISGESNVIFGSESYLPRSLFFNGTINLFGNSINPLEFNIRMQGLEKYVESIFGLTGPLNFDQLINKFGFLYDKIKNLFTFESEIIDTFLRSRRSANKTNELIDKLAYTQKYNFNEPTGYIEHKIFGNDISFDQFEGFEELSNLIKKLLPMDKLSNFFSNRDEIFLKSGTLMDVSYTVPVLSGFPLTLSGFGAYSLDTRYSASLNTDWEKYSLDFNGKFKPSLSMEMTSKIQMDLFHAATEIKVKSNIYSNYAVETDFQITSNKYASLNVKLPLDRNDIFSVRSELSGNVEGEDVLLNGILNRYVNSTCTWPSIDDMLGLKVCVDFSLPDVSDANRIYPSLVLSGPIIFDIHLDKSDLSAKFFNFLYQWNKENEVSEGSITFETPHTKIPRHFSAKLRTDLYNYNLTMGFKNGDQTLKALGIIKNVQNEKSADISINVNENEHFSLELRWTKKVLSKTKSLVNPRFMLIVNNQKVAGMAGIIKTIEKNNVTQHDFDLKFETKRIQSSAVGHVIITEHSVTNKMQYTYKFSGKKEETIDVDTELANRSQKSRERTEYYGFFKFVSSAYNHYNFASGASFISSLGHVEAKLDVNNAPDLLDPSYTLTTRLSLAKNAQDMKNSRSIFSVEVKRERTSTDLKFYVRYDEHFKNGTEHNVLSIVRYGSGNEIIASGSLLLPRGPLFGIDATFNLSIPEMNSSSVVIKIKERVKKDFYIDLSGEWFGGENLKISGLFQDRTSNVKRYYRLKSLISSKLFEDINCNLKYSRDLQELKFKVLTEYKTKIYSLLVESLENDPKESITRGQLNWAESSYTLSANTSFKGIGRSIVEIHLDRIRDIHLEVWGIAEKFGKNFGIEFKWDANRDPSQKFILSYFFDKPQLQVYSGNVLIGYPDRTLNGIINLSNKGPYTGTLKISWSADEVIDLEYSIGSEFTNYNKVWAVMKVDTPFSGWNNNRVNGTFYQKDNLMLIGFSTMWAEHQNIAFDFHVDYLFSDIEMSGELKAEIQSTIQDIPIVLAILKHNQTLSKADSVVLFKHKNFVSDDFRTFSMKSSWKHSADYNHNNVSGSIKFRSPFEGYNSGAMITKFSIRKEERELSGAFDVDIDARVYSFTVEGYIKRFLDNMISFNLTTPIATFPYLLGKFGIVETKRYLIFDLKTLNRTLGLEGLFNFNSITDFDLKFYLATPQPALERVLTICKIKEDTIHLEGSWNKISLGFKGIWHFVHYNDFEYSYVILTPLANFEENGLVIKFKAENVQNFDIESSFKIGKYKLGVKAYGEPRVQLINQLGLRKASFIRESFHSSDLLASEETLDDPSIDTDLIKYCGVIGKFEISTFLWNPLVGNYEVQQVDDTYHGEAKVLMSQGVIEVKNSFVMAKNFNYLNRLRINTSFQNLRSVTSNFELQIPEEKGLKIRFEVGILKKVWTNYGFKLKYKIPQNALVKIHDINLIILYPLTSSSKTSISAKIELAGKHIRSASLILNGLETYLKLSGAVKEYENKNVDIVFNTKLNSTTIQYTFDTYVRKESSENKNQISIGFMCNENREESKFDAILQWREDNKHVIDGDFSIISNIFPIQNLNTSIFISEQIEPKFNLEILYGKSTELLEEFKFNIAKKDLHFDGELITPFQEYSHIRFDGLLTELEQPGKFKAKGIVYKNLLTHNFEGDVSLNKNIPSTVHLRIKNLKGSDTDLNYSLDFQDMKRSIKARVSNEKDFLTFESELYIQNLLDWAYNIKVQSSKSELNELMLSTSLTPITKGRSSWFDSSFEMITPWPTHFIEKINVSSQLKLNDDEGELNLSYEISRFVGSAGCLWKSINKELKQEYLLKMFTDKNEKSKKYSTEISFSNSSIAPTNFNIQIDIDSWTLTSKAIFNIQNTNDMALIYDLSAPSLMNNSHSLKAHYRAHDFPLRIMEGAFIDMQAQYTNEVFSANVKTKGSMESLSNISSIVGLEWSQNNETRNFDSNFTLEKFSEKVECNLDLSTPYYIEEKTLKLQTFYYYQDIFKIIHATIHSPESRQITIGDVAFADLANMKGSVNCTLPVFNISWFDVNFDFDKHNEESGKFIKATWPDNSALFDSKSTFLNQTDYKEWKGTIKTELPLHTTHNIQIVYGLEQKPFITTGDTAIEYNTKSVINSHYTCKTEKNESDSKDIINLSIENEFKPLGIYYTHQKKKTDLNEIDKRHLEIFDLSKENRFNVTGEFTVETDDENQNYTLVAIHPNRTIIWNSVFSSMDRKNYQSSKIELAKNIWLGYRIEILNHTDNEHESQELRFKVSYPSRDVSLGALYVLKNDSFDTDASIKWEKKENSEEPKSIQGKFKWSDLEPTDQRKDHQTVWLQLSHPSFDKNVSLQGSFYRHELNSANLEVDFDYTEDEYHHAKLKIDVENVSKSVGYKNYTISIAAKHEASEMNLMLEGSLGSKPNKYQVEASANYKRGYLPSMEMELLSFLDFEKKEVKVYRSTPNKIIDVYASSCISFPVYTVDAIYIDSPEYDTSGALRINLAQKLINANINFTSDASQNLQVHGIIPDTRSAFFNVWRNYEDVRIDDISSFCQMNHSRLITSKLIWRPKLREEIKATTKKFMTDRYNALSDELDYWVKTFYTEALDTIKGILDESTPFTKEFLDDLSAIKDLDEDINALRIFLNDSYQADDFYVQSFMNYTIAILDELAITDHFQTIPKIIKEMWEVLGESSMAFKNSILWIIETIKTSYKESVEMFNELMQGSSFEHITKILEMIIEKYDRFVKDIHVTFMSYVEAIWDNLVRTFSIYWNRVLQNIEPQIIRSIHYIESVIWGISTEIFDFMYNRTNELIESPYFTKVSNITHDLDILYQDLQNNDAFTNVRKYSGVMIQFLREKFLSMVPFGKELREIFSDIISELRELKKVELLREAFQRYEEIVSKINWLMTEFQFEKRLNILVDIIKNKLSRITQNAIQSEDIYREAKTKFIFDPDKGNIEWEQKLPMAWHAFNETPLFDEIPEYKLFNRIQSFAFSKGNNSIWKVYYNLKQISEPENILPPFKSQALLIGSLHVISFDNLPLNLDENEFGEKISRREVKLDERCSYLLAHDFVDNRFSFILSSSIYEEQNKIFLSKSFVIQTGGDKIEIELGNPKGAIRIGDNEASILPASFGENLITREFNVVTVSSRRGFKVKCNQEFDVCNIELSGWYFGKIAGILGTMNNENFDDLTMSDTKPTSFVKDFVESWKLTPSCLKGQTFNSSNDYEEVARKSCDLFFKKKTSYFASCYNIVDPKPFHDICLRLSRQPRYQTSSFNAEKSACTAGMAYIEACLFQNVPLRVPDSCIHCKLPNGSFITEGTFTELKDNVLTPSVDVVFLMEAKSCNVEFIQHNLMSTLMTAMSSEFEHLSIDQHRYAVVTFGGSNEFDQPRSVTSSGQVFASAKDSGLYFKHLKAGNGSSDVFTAITVASKLIFKPGATKIFVLFICSTCEFNLLKFDIKSVSQLLKENDITLHIMSENVFNVKKVLGVDKTKAFVRKDHLKLTGDEILRKQVSPIKPLGHCATLAFDTDGSIFSSKASRKKNENDFNAISSVFAKRIVKNVRAIPCHFCECEGHNSGTAFMTCMSCEHKSSLSSDYDVNDDEDDFYEEEL